MKLALLSPATLSSRMSSLNWLVIGLGLLGVAFCGWLIWNSYTSQKKLQQINVQIWQEQAEHRAQMLSTYFHNRIHEVRQWSRSNPVKVYFESKALGMTMEYGLGASLSFIRNSFLSSLQESRYENAPLYTRILLLDASGKILVDTEHTRTPPAETGRSPGRWREMLTPDRTSPQLRLFNQGEGADLLITSPVYFKSKYVGQVLAWLDMRTVSQKLFPRAEEPWQQTSESVYLSFGDTVILPSRAAEGGERLNELEPFQRIEKPSSLHNGILGAGLLGSDSRLGLRLELEDTPLSLLWIRSADVVQGSASPHELLLIFAVFLLLLLASSVWLLRISRRNEDLQKRLLQAQKMEAVGTLAGGIAHDFNNLLQIISGSVEFMKSRRSVEDKERKHLDRVEETVRQGEQLVKGLLTFSRKQEPEFKRLDVNRLIRDLLELMQRAMPREIKLKADLASELPAVRGDLVQLQQALLNLINNARDAIDSEQGGEITISTRALTGSIKPALPETISTAKGSIEIEVLDNGSGMDSKTQEHIFEPFFTTKGKKRGSGLGLAMVYGIVRDQGGIIECSSKPGQGTSFRILLPALEGREGDETKEGGDAGKEEDSLEAASILVVEDEPLLREMAWEFLQDCGYEVTAAESGEKALDLYRNGERFEVVVTDVSLPGMTGYELMSSLSAFAKKQRIILVSGNSEEIREKAAGKEGQVDFLQKPFSLNDLQQRVRALLGG